MKLRLVSAVVSVIVLATSLFGCGKDVTEPQSKTYFEYFDTVSVISSYSNDPEEVFSKNCADVAALFDEYHKLFDIYYEYSGVNNIRTINKNAGRSPVSVDVKLIDFLEYAIDMCKKTELETNIAMGSVLSLWHNARELYDEGETMIPDHSELELAAAHIDPNAVIIDREAGTVYISDENASLDVGSIGKGYATMKAAELLRERNAYGYVLNIGGNIATIGSKPDGSGWVTGITNPDGLGDDDYVTRIELKDRFCVTSGDYERYLTYNGKRYHHIIDKDTLMPAEYFRAATVVCDNGAVADLLSTALFCMPYDEGRILASETFGVEVLWVFADGHTEMTDGFSKILLK